MLRKLFKILGKIGVVILGLLLLLIVAVVVVRLAVRSVIEEGSSCVDTHTVAKAEGSDYIIY